MLPGFLPRGTLTAFIASTAYVCGRGAKAGAYLSLQPKQQFLLSANERASQNTLVLARITVLAAGSEPWP
jgi:hypothetical protein